MTKLPNVTHQVAEYLATLAAGLAPSADPQCGECPALELDENSPTLRCLVVKRAWPDYSHDEEVPEDAPDYPCPEWCPRRI